MHSVHSCTPPSAQMLQQGLTVPRLERARWILKLCLICRWAFCAWPLCAALGNKVKS